MATINVRDMAELCVYEEDFDRGQFNEPDRVSWHDIRGTYDSAQKLIDAIGWNVGLFDDWSPQDFKFRDGGLTGIRHIGLRLPLSCHGSRISAQESYSTRHPCQG